MSLEKTAEEYFASINTIAKRMYEDMKDTKSAYEDLWNTIPDKQRKELLSEAIIKPEVSIKYNSSDSNHNEEFATKYVMEDNYTYRDEHSGPFSFKTRSQRDLSLFEKAEAQMRVSEKKVQPKLKKAVVEEHLNERSRILECDSEQTADTFLPKTGLDFLDNW